MGEFNINPVHNVHKKYRQVNFVNPYIFGSGFDADAQAFITTAVITDTGQKTAINNLVVALKSSGIWAKTKAIYPIIGGTEFSHKFNLKDPRDLDVSFRLVFNGTITNNSNGITFGSSSSLDTKFTPSVDSVINNFQYSYYCRNEISGAYLFRCNGGGGAMQFFANISSLLLSDMYNTTGSTGRILGSNTSSIGLFTASRLVPGTKHSVYRNGVLKYSNGTTAGTLPNVSIKVNDNLGTQGSNCAFITIGDGLSDVENTNLYNIIQAYQTALSRQV